MLNIRQNNCIYLFHVPIMCIRQPKYDQFNAFLLLLPFYQYSWSTHSTATICVYRLNIVQIILVRLHWCIFQTSNESGLSLRDLLFKFSVSRSNAQLSMLCLCRNIVLEYGCEINRFVVTLALSFHTYESTFYLHGGILRRRT